MQRWWYKNAYIGSMLTEILQKCFIYMGVDKVVKQGPRSRRLA